jgi:hypothetical protein
MRCDVPSLSKPCLVRESCRTIGYAGLRPTYVCTIAGKNKNKQSVIEGSKLSLEGESSVSDFCVEFMYTVFYVCSVLDHTSFLEQTVMRTHSQ